MDLGHTLQAWEGTGGCAWEGAGGQAQVGKHGQARQAWADGQAGGCMSWPDDGW
jgi:hypothetical protein